MTQTILNPPADKSVEADNIETHAVDPAYVVSVLQTFFEEVVEALRNCESMIDSQGHAHICQKYLDFFTYRIPGSDAAIREIGLAALKLKPSFRDRLARRIPRSFKLALSRVAWLYVLVLAFDALIFPRGSARTRIALRDELRRRTSGRLRFRLAQYAFIRWLDQALLRPKWREELRAKPLQAFSRDDIAALAQKLVDTQLPGLIEGWQLAQRLDAEPRDVHVFVTHLFPTTWSPLVNALNARGVHTVWCGIDNPQESAGYGVLETPLVQTTTHADLMFLGVIVFLCATCRCQILMSGECFYGSNWNAEDTTVLYSLLSSVLATMRRLRQNPKNLNLIMYDGLKPINAAGSSENSAITYYYKRLMNLGDRIIYNSNTELLGSFNQYAIPLKAPRLHFYRYSEPPLKPKPRIDLQGGKNIHLACITVCLGEFGEPSRDAVVGYVRDIIRSGIHFHYYCIADHPLILKFKRDLGKHGHFLHLHPIIKDQSRLVEDLHQYHAGFNPSDHVPFARGISSLDDRFYQDAMSVFLQSTIGTSFLVYAAAGLPVLLPRGCVGAAQLLGDVAIPVIFSEMDNLRQLLQDCGLERRLALADANCANVHIGTHIERYLRFMKIDAD
jgi:hypothetical protein